MSLPASDRLFEAAIIGAGPAGAAAAIQLKRYGIDPLIFEKERIGGLLHNANLVENYPGFPGGIPGTELVDRIRTHLEEVGVEVIFQKVCDVDYDSGVFYINTSDGCWYSRRLVLATGTEPCRIDVPMSAGAADRVLSEVYPLLPEIGLRVLVVGGGDAAFDYALNISHRKGDVAILNRGEAVKCLPLLWKRADACPSIRYLRHIQILSIGESDHGKDLVAVCESPDGVFELNADYILFAIGRKPVVGLFSDRLQVQHQDLIEAGVLYSAGDVHNGIYRQTAIAAGDGIRAAMQICCTYENRPIEVSFISRRIL